MRTRLFGLLFMMISSTSTAQAACADTAAGRALDFWLGDWTVHTGEDQVGTNAIQKALDGCAIFEHWENRFGNQGKSLFYFDAVEDTWQQVWVTEDTSRPGGLKLKSMAAQAEGMVRFEGTLMHPTRGEYLDRTTLTLETDETVRQLIEVSFDGGASWQISFDAVYRPVEVP